MISRAELAELFREDDRLRVEHREFMAQREALASPPVSEADGLGVIPPDDGGDALETASVANADALDEEPWDFTEAQMDTLAVVLNELRKEWQRDHAVEIAELRGEVRALLAIVGKNTGGSSPPKDADVIDLPAGFIRRRNDAA